MNFENLDSWHWIVTALIGLIALFLGYYWGTANKVALNNNDELRLYQDKNAKLEAALAECTKKLADDAKKVSGLSFSPSEAALSVIAFNPVAAKATFGKTIKENDLKVVEGIGPKIESMFRDAGIETWQKLAETNVANCQKILDSGGTRYKIHDPSSWPMQAKMCYEGKWTALLRWQEKHKAGKL
jgi:predicted flap endonuclease-1-like 5' DNA nuclease